MAQFAQMSRQQTNGSKTRYPDLVYTVTDQNRAEFQGYVDKGFCKFLTQKEFDTLKKAAGGQTAPKPSAKD